MRNAGDLGFLVAHVVNDAALLDLRSRGLSTANVGSCCVISLHKSMGERVNQPTARHLHRQCFAIQPSVGYAACLDYHIGCRNCRAHELNTAKVDYLHDFSLPAVTESRCACYAKHLGDSVCPVIFHNAKVSHSPSHIHVRVTMVIRWLFAVRSVHVAGFWNFRDVSLCCAMRKRAKQYGVRPAHGPNTAKVKHTCDSALQEGPAFWTQWYHSGS